MAELPAEKIPVDGASEEGEKAFFDPVTGEKVSKS
jgi:hypothetical protein